ncbi:unnamed protein product [Polarella glacialis]|uniref:Molybdate-anion transporter n=1 Tax=Polarella glacialis TaxID=89957 RepID=A0A813HXU1_POLGL|nr:unnamed protein product [Polarella glacialis]
MISHGVALLPGYFTQSFYHMCILPLLVKTLLLAWWSRPSTSETRPVGFAKFQVTYLSVWSLCVGADWLQGPYVYALYQAYGIEKHDIARLFVAGFASSLFFSCFVGSVADRFGRKKCCMAYCVFYILSCMTKHYNYFWVLMLGRITGGLATSLLFSCFECWMVSEHIHRHGFSSKLLSYMFGLMYTLMYFVAILCGLVAQVAVDARKLAPIHPGSMVYAGGESVAFDMSAAVLLVALVLIGFTWDENYGKVRGVESGGLVESTKEGLRLLLTDRDSLCLCVLVSCFESAMYAFVFNWTPALDGDVEVPHGVVFSLFMMACMCGASASTLATTLASTSKLAMILLLGILALCLSAATAGSSVHACLLGFLWFEFCCGAYFPSVGVLKSEIVPEHVRGAIYNLFRVPLNAIVVILLLNDFSAVTCFKLCAMLVSVGLVATTQLTRGKASAAAGQVEVQSRPLRRRRRSIRARRVGLEAGKGLAQVMPKLLFGIFSGTGNRHYLEQVIVVLKEHGPMCRTGTLPSESVGWACSPASTQRFSANCWAFRAGAASSVRTLQNDSGVFCGVPCLSLLLARFATGSAKKAVRIPFSIHVAKPKGTGALPCVKLVHPHDGSQVHFHLPICSARTKVNLHCEHWSYVDHIATIAELDPALLIRRLKKEVAELKDELKLLNSDDGAQDVTEEDKEECKKLLSSYLAQQDLDSPFSCGSIVRFRECFKMLREVYWQNQVEGLSAGGASGGAVGSRQNPTGAQKADPLMGSLEANVMELRQQVVQRDQEIGILVGSLSKRSGNAAREAAQDGRVFIKGAPRGAPPGQSGGAPAEVDSASLLLDRNKAFEVFRKSVRRSETLEEGREAMKSLVTEAKTLGERANAARAAINTAKTRVEKARMERAMESCPRDPTAEDGAMPLDSPEVVGLLSQIEEHKGAYKQCTERLKAVKADIDKYKLAADQNKERLQKDFEGWYLSLQASQGSSSGGPTAEAEDLSASRHLSSASSAAPAAPQASGGDSSRSAGAAYPALRPAEGPPASPRAASAGPVSAARATSSTPQAPPATKLTGHQQTDDDIAAYFAAIADLQG